jgi:hypothetical protein
VFYVFVRRAAARRTTAAAAIPLAAETAHD